MKLQGIDVSKVKKLSELAPLLSTTDEGIADILTNQKDLIQYSRMRKANGEFRNLVRIQDDPYRHLLRRINLVISREYLMVKPESVHGFVKGKSILTNAQRHTQRKIVINADIKNFFDTITKTDVQEIFKKLGFKENIAQTLAELTTVEGVLATGLPTSPTLSNFRGIEMDGAFEQYAQENGFTYTRYADDLTFSSNNDVPSKKQIVTILNQHGFELNERKFQIYRKGGPQYVTGLSVVDERPRLSRRFKRALRLEAYYIKKYGFSDHFLHTAEKSFKQPEISCVSELREITINPPHRHFGKLTSIAFHGYGVAGFISHIHSIEPEFAKQLTFLLGKKHESDEFDSYWFQGNS